MPFNSGKTDHLTPSRREWLAAAGALPAGVRLRENALQLVQANMPGAAAKAEPRALPINHDPQLFVDDYLVDNRWGLRDLTETVMRVFHAPRKDGHNPVLPGVGGYVSVVRDQQAGLFRMWHALSWNISFNPRKWTVAVAYAESPDGIRWKQPRIGKHSFKETLDNNVVLLGPAGGDAQSQYLLDVPAQDRRGYRYLMLYLSYDAGHRGVHLIGSHDGIDWDPASDMLIFPNFLPDTHMSIVWDPQIKKYVCFTRATNLYHDDASGPRRRVARLEHSRLWDRWPIFTENVLIPDELDVKSGHNYFYGMPVRYYAGIYWGFLWPYRQDEDIYTELAFSRDGRSFARLPERPRLIGLGPADAWDCGMVLGSDWLQVDGEWWFYYGGNNRGHKSAGGTAGVGLARLRKEGFVSLRSPAGGGVVVTRLLTWPGGQLHVNADASQGELTVKVTGYDRKPLAGFDPQPSLAVVGDSVRHAVQWRNGNLGDWKGRAIRLEFFMKNVVDLYGFQAVPAGERP